ncbi:Fic family protein [Pseudomonas palleroniana]|uniref:Fic family protein n=1 Tax=Pseudomonas palleroniana TaxID=191390 RepID=A0A1H5KP44_9PSED|nr:Fic family protein [Pseudomonas palleroniana]KAB0568437.1 Fic family protein [Pseudomonas palleroniana]PTC28728.1 Fic family protein [Pseudomonas palleroniana]SEE66404.1 Fic family protein [Pseudomonas palleroniana]
MAQQFISGNHWLEPIWPSSGFPASILRTAETLSFRAGKLTGLLPENTAMRIGGLMRITNSYYSNLIEGQYTEPVTLSARVPRRDSKELRELAESHIGVQELLERVVRRPKAVDAPWSVFFAPEFMSVIHRRLFVGAGDKDLRLSDGRLLAPGQLRDTAKRNVLVGDHAAPAWESVTPMLKRLQHVYGGQPDLTSRILSSLSYHHRLAFVHPFEDGNGRVVRMITHLQLMRLGLASPLWSLSRGLARKQEEYYGRLRAADQPRRGDLDGRGQLTQGGLFEFVEFMLQVCIDQMEYVEKAMDLVTLRQRLERVIGLEGVFVESGVKQEMAKAIHILLTQGEIARADFKIFSGLHDRVASDQLKKLIDMGVVEAPSAKSRSIYPGLPVWFAQMIFPDLHRRFY